MGIFDRPKNYRMRSPSTIESYEERLQRLVKIVNIVIEDLHNPLLEKNNPAVEKKINEKLENLKKIFKDCRHSAFVNHQDLNNLAKRIRSYIFYLIKIYQSDDLEVETKIDSETEINIKINIDIYKVNTFSYDADRWMIKMNDKDLWYLGR